MFCRKTNRGYDNMNIVGNAIFKVLILVVSMNKWYWNVLPWYSLYMFNMLHQ